MTILLGSNPYRTALWAQASADGEPALFSALPGYVRLLTDDTSTQSTATGIASAYRTSGPYVETGPFVVTGGTIRLQGGASDSSVRIVVGTVTAGTPDAPLAASDAFTVTASAAMADYDFTFATPASFTGSGDVMFYVGVWCSVQITIRSIDPASPFTPGYSVWRSGTATYASTGSPPAPTGSMTSGGATVSDREFAVVVTVRPAAPAQVTGLSATASGTTIALSWSAVSGADRYLVRRDGTPVAKVATTSYTDRGLAASTPYGYTVSAETRSATGAQSSSASATTGAAPFTPVHLITPAAYAGAYPPPGPDSGYTPTWAATLGTGIPESMRSLVEDERGGIYVNWGQIETTATPGVYSWAIIDDALSSAEARGRRLIVHIRAFVPGAGNVLPSFVTGADVTTISGDTIPVWGSTNVRTWWRDMVLAFGSRYSADLRLLGAAANQGQFGERIHTGVYAGAAPSAATAGDYDDDLADAFATGHVLLIYATGGSEGRASLDTMLTTYPRARVRSQAWGEDTAWRNVVLHRAGAARRALRDVALAGLRPHTLEAIATPTDDELTRMGAVLQDTQSARMLPAGLFAERNLPTYSTATQVQRDALDAVRNAIGVRLRLAAVQAPGVIVSGQSFAITSAWALAGGGIADAYTVRWQLRTGATLVTSADSALDLRTLDPIGASNPLTHQDTVTLTAARGTYTLAVQVVAPTGDPTGALPLLNHAAQSGYWYPLTTMQVL